MASAMKLTITEALLDKDTNAFLDMDPYYVIEYEGNKQSGEKAYGMAKEPKWDQTKTIPMSANPRGMVKISFFNDDDYICHIEIPVQQLTNNSNTWYECVRVKDSGSKPSGSFKMANVYMGAPKQEEMKGGDFQKPTQMIGSQADPMSGNIAQGYPVIGQPMAQPDPFQMPQQQPMAPQQQNPAYNAYAQQYQAQQQQAQPPMGFTPGMQQQPMMGGMPMPPQMQNPMYGQQQQMGMPMMQQPMMGGMMPQQPMMGMTPQQPMMGGMPGMMQPPQMPGMMQPPMMQMQQPQMMMMQPPAGGQTFTTSQTTTTNSNSVTYH